MSVRKGEINDKKHSNMVVNEKELTKKIANFFNILSPQEVVYLRRFTMTKKWISFFDTRCQGRKIEL